MKSAENKKLSLESNPFVPPVPITASGMPVPRGYPYPPGRGLPRPTFDQS